MKDSKVAVVFVATICAIAVGVPAILEMIDLSFFSSDTTVQTITIVSSVIFIAVVITASRISAHYKEYSHNKR